MRNTFQIVLVGFILFFNAQYVSAQEVKRDTSNIKWRNSIINVQSIYERKEQPFTKDTLTGTAMLLNDGENLYLVTTKKLLQAALYGKNQQSANDSVFLKIDFKKYLNLNGLSDKNSQKSAVVFSDDEQDIAVISLQKKAYGNVLNRLLTRYRPVSIKLIDTSTSWHTNDWLMTYQINDFLYPKSTKPYGGIRSSTGSATFVAQIDQYDASSSLFTIKYPPAGGIAPGNNGGEVVANDKLIGMLRNATGFESNQDIIKSPYYVTHNGRVIKAAYILRLLRKLQMLENNPDFDN